MGPSMKREEGVRDDKIEMRRWEDAREMARRNEREGERERERERKRGETKCANKANMRADLQPGGQRYFHRFVEIVGINFSPLFTDGFPFHPLCERSLTPDLRYRALRAFNAYYALMRHENAYRGVSMHRYCNMFALYLYELLSLSLSLSLKTVNFFKLNFPKIFAGMDILPLISQSVKDWVIKKMTQVHVNNRIITKTFIKKKNLKKMKAYLNSSSFR